MNLDRFESLVGLNNLVKIKNLRILIVGLGGVGGYVFETLIRSGIENFTIIDGDIIDETNLNRQIISNMFNVGDLKVEEAKKRALSINKNVNVNCYNIFLNQDNIKKFNFGEFDYVVDACDDITAKKLIIEEALGYEVKIISSMGTAKKMDASKVYLTTLDKTSYDPLARNMRKMIDKKFQKKVVVVSSSEEVKDIKNLGSNSYVPAIAGVLITNYIINDAVKFDKQ